MKKIKSKAILKASMEVTFEIGKSIKTIEDVLNIEKGSTIRLEEGTKGIVKMKINNKDYAQGKAMRKDGELYVKLEKLLRKK